MQYYTINIAWELLHGSQSAGLASWCVLFGYGVLYLIEKISLSCNIHGILLLDLLTSTGCFCPRIFISNNGSDLSPWTTFISDLPYKPRIICRSASHYDDVTMSLMASQITSLTVVYSTVYSDADQRKHQSSASLAFVWGIHRDRWIPRTKGQLRGICFHLMTSSWDTAIDAVDETLASCLVVHF